MALPGIGAGRGRRPLLVARRKAAGYQPSEVTSPRFSVIRPPGVRPQCRSAPRATTSIGAAGQDGRDASAPSTLSHPLLARHQLAAARLRSNDSCVLDWNAELNADNRRSWRRSPSPEPHSITSSARRRIDSGIVMPSALAVRRLITSSNLEGRSTGSSPGFAPLKILSTKLANR